MSNIIFCKEHKYVHLETIYNKEREGPYSNRFTRRDRFYCERCMTTDEVYKEECAIEVPDWYKGYRR